MLCEPNVVAAASAPHCAKTHDTVPPEGGLGKEAGKVRGVNLFPRVKDARELRGLT